MSNRKSNGQFQPGHKFSKGRAPLPEDIKEARKVNRQHLEKVLNEFLQMPFDELKLVIEDWKRPAIEVMAANIIVQATAKADHFRMGFILDRLGLVVKKAEDDKKTDENLHAQIVETLNQIEYKNGQSS